MNWYYAKEIKLAISSFWHQIGKISVAVTGCLIAGYLINSFLFPEAGIVIFGLKIAGYTIVYAVVMYMLAMNQMERDKIRQIFTKFHRT